MSQNQGRQKSNFQFSGIYKRATNFSVVFLGLISIIWFCKVCVLRPEDKTAYQELIKKQELIRGGVKAVPTSAYQTREKVRKDLWISQEDKTRLHYRIDSRSSILTFIPGQQKVDIIENLQNIQGWTQDKVYMEGGKPMQQVRFFSADQGTYQYSAQQFIAQSVHLSLFKLPGQELRSDTPLNLAFMHGVAQDASFSLSGKTPAFQAQHFKASISGGQ